MTDRELMQQALEALMDAQLHNYALKHKETDDLITALRERLAQPEPAPGYCKHCKQYTIEEPLPAQPETVMAEYKFQTYAAYKTDGEMKIGVVPEQEPVAFLYRDSWGTMKLSQVMPPPVGAFPVYTTPPRREWVGLTEAEKVNVAISCGCADVAWMDFADAIEAKLKEKNAP